MILLPGSSSDTLYRRFRVGHIFRMAYVQSGQLFKDQRYEDYSNIRDADQHLRRIQRAIVRHEGKAVWPGIPGRGGIEQVRTTSTEGAVGGINNDGERERIALGV